MKRKTFNVTKVTLRTNKGTQQVKDAVTTLVKTGKSGPHLITKINCKSVKDLNVKSHGKIKT